MTKTVRVLCGETIGANPDPNIPNADRQPDGQPLPPPEAENAAETGSIFDPHLELNMP